MNKLNESYVVTLVDRGGDHLKVVADDGTHGVANCQFPREWHGISRYDKSNYGRKFVVDNLHWTGKFYRVTPSDIISEVTNDNNEKAKINQKDDNTNTKQNITAQDNVKNDDAIVAFDWDKMFQNLSEDIDWELNRYEVYNQYDDLMNVFDDESEAIDWAIANNGAYIDLSSSDTANFERIWTANDDIAKCDWCNEYFDSSELMKTDLGNLCSQCYSAIKSRGENLTIYEDCDDDISELFL